MPSLQNIFAGGSTLAVVLVTSAAPAIGAAAAPIRKLTKTTAAAAARKDAQAATTISGGDRVIVSNCRPYGRSAYKCAVQLVPQASMSRCHWTDTITLVKGKPDVRYSRIVCSG